jgi:hypothetical protein
MDFVVAQYIGFVVALLVVIWGITELGRRRTHWARRNGKTLNTWVTLDSRRADTMDEVSAEEDSEEQEEKAALHQRAQQNGHYSESKKTL